MKGTFFKKPIEYKIEIDGESWTQGEEVNGTLTVVNHDSSDISLSEIGAHLAFTDLKKMKAQNEKAFNFLEGVVFPDETLASSKQSELKFNFKLPSNVQITDTTSSLYIVCGKKNSPFDGGQLQLNITPLKIITNFIEIFENFFRFKFKPLKNKKDFVESKVIAPTSNDWSKIQQLNLKMRVVDSNLELSFNFKMKQVSYDTGALETKDSKLVIDKTLSSKEHTSFGDSPNQDGIMKAITEVLDQVKLKPFV